ncbi:MAG: hypothetical protein ACTSR2_09170 [Candidatus Hodarchaeales archaeon]
MRLIDDVHDFYRISEKTFHIDPKQIDIYEFTQEIRKEMQILYPDRVILINNRDSGSRPLKLDKDRIIQVVNRLVDNAIKNSPRKL